VILIVGCAVGAVQHTLVDVRASLKNNCSSVDVAEDVQPPLLRCSSDVDLFSDTGHAANNVVSNCALLLQLNYCKEVVKLRQ